MNEIKIPEYVIQEAIERQARECCGHLDMDGRGPELMAELERQGWKLARIDPFAAAELPSSCCGGWVGPGGQRTMCCPVASPGPSNEALAAALDAFQEAAEQYALDKVGGSRSHQTMTNARAALVRLVAGERAGSINAPAIGGADVEPAKELLTDRVERIEGWIDQQDEGWRYR